MRFDPTGEEAPAEEAPAARAGPPDDASDLFGWPPRDPVVCDGCGELAEPYRGTTCWCCFHVARAMSAEWRRLKE